MAQPAAGMEKLLEWDNEPVPLGIYISVPFCRTKCSYCNFASDVFSRTLFERYVDRVCADISNARSMRTRWADVSRTKWIPSTSAAALRPFWTACSSNACSMLSGLNFLFVLTRRSRSSALPEL